MNVIKIPAGDRALGPTFDINNIIWIDFETASESDVRQVGSRRYAMEARAIALAYAIGNNPVQVISRWEGLRWKDMPKELREADPIKFAAWNAGFDKSIWNYATDFPPMKAHEIIDVMAQGMAAGLPNDLFMASRAVGGDVVKQKEGKALLALFCLPGATATPQSHPEQWRQLLAYAADDIEAMRNVFLRTRQLSLAEWREYWSMEAVNDRGVVIDLKMAEHAARLAEIDRKRSNDELVELTAGAVKTVDSVKAMTAWLMAALPPKAQEILTSREEEVDEDTGELIKPAKRQLTRRRVDRLLAYCQESTMSSSAVERVLQIRRYGGSKTPAKFPKMTLHQVDGVLYGQYVFNGAGQTGRASSRGVQVHNLARDVLPYEHDAIEALLASASYEDFAQVGDDTPVSRKLSLLIRPTFIPEPGNVFVWSDWSQIEARVLPWLAGNVPGALDRLDIFRANDANPSSPDLYTLTAAALSHCNVGQVTKAMRQRGKVAELALGFGGGVGALQNMAANYGMFLDDVEAKQTVDGWRKNNAWCVQFWGTHGEERSIGLWGAINRAMLQPGTSHQAGRLVYTYLHNYLGGSLLCMLPSGRLLTYRGIRYESVEELDDNDEPTGTFSVKLRFARGHGRAVLWHGLACENVVQATAADFLRGTIVRLVDRGFDVRLHTHDEIVLEAFEYEAKTVETELRVLMQRGFDWSEGLPIMSEETISPYYTKQEF